MNTSVDAPIARNTLVSITRPARIWFLCIMTLIAACLAIAGMVLGGLKALDHSTVPDATLMLLLGIGGFALFFPWFLCIWCCRVLLRAVITLEQKVEAMHTPAPNKALQRTEAGDEASSDHHA